MRAVVSVYEDGNKVSLAKKSFFIADEADLEQKNEDIKDFLLDQMYEQEERVGI